MKVIKLVSVAVYLLFTVSTSSKAQDMSNVYALLAEGYTINELHDYVDRLTLFNHRKILEEAGMTFQKHDTNSEFYIYKKNDYVSFYVNYAKGELTSVHVVSSPQKFYKAIDIIKGNSQFVKNSEKASGTGTVTYYDFSGHSLAVNDNYFRVTMWVKEKTKTEKTTATTSPATPIAVETYYSAKEIADAMNANMGWAKIGFAEPNYQFDVKGSLDMDRKSIRFISKENVLYVQLNIPRNGSCDYGLKEVKAKWTGQAGGGATQYYFTFEYPYSCNNVYYKNLYVTFKLTPSFTKAGVEAWIRKNTY